MATQGTQVNFLIFLIGGFPMSAQIPTKTQTQVNSSNKLFFNSCLVATRHKLLQSQENDVKQICGNIDIVPELPSDQQQLKQIIQPYDAVIAILPLPLQIQILQAKKTFLTFVMESLGVTETKEQAEAKASQYPERTAILLPSKPGEKWRVTLYKGIKIVKEIKVVDEWIIQHQS